MKFFDTLFRRPSSLRSEPVREATSPAAPVREAASRANEDRGWRRASFLGGTLLNPDRDELHGQALLQEAFLAWSTNPHAYAIVEEIMSFVLGGGARVVAQNSRVQKVIDEFWDDPENRMDLRIYSIQRELSLFGEQFLRFFVDPLTGRTVIRQLDPLYVAEIETHPDDLEKPLRYLYSPPQSFGGSAGRASAVSEAPEKPARGSGGAQRPPAGPGSARDEDLHGTWIPAKDILHIAENKISSALRGRSDLAPCLPDIRRYREWGDDRILLNKLRTSFIWDVTVTGAEKPDIDRLRAQFPTGPARGTVLFHSEDETWKAVDPQIDAADAAPDGRAIRLNIATGALLPEHYLGEGGNANRATAAEMGLPAIKRLQRKQQVFRALLTAVVNRVLDEAQRTGRLGPRVKRTFTVQLEELATSSQLDLAGTLNKFAEALALATDRGWINRDEARSLWWRFCPTAEEHQPEAA